MAIIAQSAALNILRFDDVNGSLIVQQSVDSRNRTANIQEWQSFSGSVLASMSSVGTLTIPNLVVSGDFTVSGTTTNINSTNLVVEDKNIVLADVASPTDITADGAGFTIKGATDKTFNWVNSTGAFTSSEPISSPYLIVTGSTAPTNGIYLPAANTLGFATNSGLRMQINANGELGIGTGPAAGVAINLGKASNNAIVLSYNATGSNTTYGIQNQPQIQSDSTASHRSFQSQPSTAAGSYNVDYIVNYFARMGSLGAGSSINTHYGFLAESSLVAATANYGFYGNIPSGTSRWNFYANGTAANYFAGQVSIGTTSLTMGSGSAATNLGIFTNSTTSVGLVVRGTTSQTANLQEWQNVSGTILGIVSSSGQLVVNASSTTMGGGNVAQQLGIFTNATTTVGLVVRGQASQTANLQEWQDSSGGILSRVDSGGSFVTTRGFSTGSASFASVTWNGVSNPSGVTGLPTLVIKGIASQTSDLQQWQNSAGTVLAKVEATGAATFSTATDITAFTVSQGGGSRTLIYGGSGLVNNSTGTVGSGTWNSIATLEVYGSSGASTRAGLLIRQASGQSGDLLQIQNASNTVINSIDRDGNIRSEAQLIQYGAEGSLLQNVPTRVHPAETLLKQAVWWIDAAHTSASSQTINNLGWGGSALNVTNGSSTSADTNDARYLDWDGRNYIYLPGVVNNFFSVPDEASLDIAGDIDLRWYGSFDSSSSSSFQVLISKGWDAYEFRVSNTSAYQLVTASGASVWNTAAGQTLPTTPTWLRVTRQKSTGIAKFFTSVDGVTWTQIGSDVSGSTSDFGNSNNVAVVGQRDGQFPLAAKVYRAQILNGIDGVPVLDMDTSVIASGAATSFTALTGQTVTVNRSTSGRKTVCVTNPLWLFGTDDYMQVDNRWLEHTGTNYLYLPGVNDNNASTPDSAAISITGDLDLRVKVALDDWTPSTATALISKAFPWTYEFSVQQNTGLLILQISTNGSTPLPYTSTVGSGIADGATSWVRVTLDVDNGAGGHDVKFFTSTDGTTWTQLGSTVTAAGTITLWDSSTALNVGSRSNSNPARGKFFRAQVLNGINGTVAFDANFETGITSNLPTTFTESSANAATVTVNYSGTGYRSAGVIASTYVYPGNPNTFKLSTTSLLDFGTTQDFSVFAIARTWSGGTGFNPLISKNLPTSSIRPGWGIYMNNSTVNFGGVISDASIRTYSNALATTTGSLNTLALVRNVTADTVQLSGTAAVTDGSTASLANFENMVIGWSSGFDMELSSAAIFRRALTAAEIAILNNYFQGRVA